ncbi:MAG: sulfatase [Actinobacteria bacterium]|nr:sulfatase [Actinomycetota bacterium]
MTRGRLIVILAIAVVVVAATSTVLVLRAAPSSAPNLLVIMADDQTLESLRVMQNVNDLLVKGGTSFSNYYVATPNCCPSRGEFYTGRYAHNTGIRDNVPPLGGAKSFVAVQNQTLPVWLQQSGYYTAHIGKFLNGWGNPGKPDYWTGGIAPPPGWDRWFGLIDPSTYAYYNYRVSVDGTERAYGNAPTDYQTDVLGQEVIDTITRAGATGKPWFVSWMPLAPHIGGKETASKEGQIPDSFTAVPAPRDAGRFASEKLPASPSISLGPEVETSADVQGKPAFVQERVKKDRGFRGLLPDAYRAELETLQALDEWVRRIYDAVASMGQLDNTVIVFASDNGLFHGEHGLYQKGLLYEEAVRVPLVVRGPGFPAGAKVDQLVNNVDLAPTLLGIAGARADVELDGRDMRPFVGDPELSKNRAVLLENWYTLTPLSTQGVRVGNWSYLEWSSGERELYDLAADPFEMTNLASDPRYRSVIADLRPRLERLRTCRGATCEDSDLSRR